MWFYSYRQPLGVKCLSSNNFCCDLKVNIPCGDFTAQLDDRMWLKVIGATSVVDVSQDPIVPLLSYIFPAEVYGLVISKFTLLT